MTGIILSGGRNTRMGTNKAFLEFNGERLIDRTFRLFKELFDEVIIVTNEPLSYLYLNAVIVSDVVKDKGALGGIYSGIFYASSEHSFVAACDMPFLNESFIGHMIGGIERYDIVVPETAYGMEPLHAIYSKNCLSPIKNLFSKDELKIIRFYKGLKVKVIPENTVEMFDPRKRMFINVNTKQDLERIENCPEKKESTSAEGR
jgi:molybdenum cofactor guanylyltransferase